MPPTGAADVQRAGAALDHAVTEAARLQREIEALERQREDGRRPRRRSGAGGP